MSTTVQQIIAALESDARRDIYEGGLGPKLKHGSGEYWITYQGGGPFPKQVVLDMVREGLLRRKYPDCECYALHSKSSIREADSGLVRAASDRIIQKYRSVFERLAK